MSDKEKIDLRTAHKRLRFGKRCPCGKVRAHSKAQSKAMAAASLDYRKGTPDPLWFYQCPKSPDATWHWTRMARADECGWVPNTEEIPDE